MGDARTERWVEHRANVRIELVDAAMRAIDKIGPQASMREIAAEANTPKARLYRFFTDKAEIFEAIAERVQEMLIARVVKDVQWTDMTVGELIRASLVGFAELIRDHPNVFRFLIQGHLTGQDADATRILESGRVIARKVAAMFSDVIATFGGGSEGVEMEAFMIVGAVGTAADWWLAADGPQPSIEEFVDRLDTIAVRGIIDSSAKVRGITIDYDRSILSGVASSMTQEQ